jgi:hypothetical protein
MAPKRPRPEEALAFEIVHRVLDAAVDHHDDNSVAGMVDATITYADGTEAALEVTTLGDQAVMQARSLIVGKHFDVPGAEWAWHATVSAADSRVFEPNVAALVLACEREEVGNVRYLDAYDPDTEALLAWAGEIDLTLIVLTGHTQKGRVFVASPGAGGFTDHAVPGFCRWLESQCATNRAAIRSVRKLEASGTTKQHLFLRVHQSALDDQLVISVTDVQSLPVEELVAPENVTDVWVLVEWMDGVLHWDGTSWHRARGWHDRSFHDDVDRRLAMAPSSDRE